MFNFKFEQLTNFEKIIGALTIIALLSFLILPIISYNFEEASVSNNETIFEIGGDSPYDRYGFNFGDSDAIFGIVISIISTVATLLFLPMKNNNAIIATSALGFLGLIIFFLTVNSQVSEINMTLSGNPNFSTTEFLGVGFWINSIIFAVNTFLCFYSKNPSNNI